MRMKCINQASAIRVLNPFLFQPDSVCTSRSRVGDVDGDGDGDDGGGDGRGGGGGGGPGGEERRLTHACACLRARVCAPTQEFAAIADCEINSRDAMFRRVTASPILSFFLGVSRIAVLLGWKRENNIDGIARFEYAGRCAFLSLPVCLCVFVCVCVCFCVFLCGRSVAPNRSVMITMSFGFISSIRFARPPFFFLSRGDA
jgi:hypothetical protein